MYLHRILDPTGELVDLVIYQRLKLPEEALTLHIWEVEIKGSRSFIGVEKEKVLSSVHHIVIPTFIGAMGNSWSHWSSTCSCKRQK